MKISIKMGQDISAGINPNIFLLSPTYKVYNIPATVVEYGKRPTVMNMQITMHSLDIETDGIVEPEDGDFLVVASIDLIKFKLSSTEYKMRIEGGKIASVKTKEQEELEEQIRQSMEPKLGNEFVSTSVTSIN